MQGHCIHLGVISSSSGLHLQMAQRRADWRVGVYVRVHGHLRSFENKKSMVVFSLKVIHDFNEVSQISPPILAECTLANQYVHSGHGQSVAHQCFVSAGVFPLPPVHLPAYAPRQRPVTVRQHGRPCLHLSCNLLFWNQCFCPVAFLLATDIHLAGRQARPWCRSVSSSISHCNIRCITASWRLQLAC